MVSIRDWKIESIDSDVGQGKIDFECEAVIPGLLNTHTHLEFSHLPTPLEPRRDFARWIATIIEHRRTWPGATLDSVGQGLAECLSAGVTGLAETATSNWLFSRPEQPGEPRLLVFREVLGLRPSSVADQIATAGEFLDQAARLGKSDVGLSPHAPYSLHPDLFLGLCDIAEKRQVPVSMHLAESPEEMELLQYGTGPLVDLFDRMGLWQPGIIATGSSQLGYLKELARAPRALIAHGNLLNDHDLEYLKSQRHLSVVYCPRTHQGMQATPHPWQKMLEMGINVTLGTDSRASNPDLSLWRELAVLQQQAPSIPVWQLLKLVTANAAQALGWSEQGELRPGSDADLCVVELPGESFGHVEETLLKGRICKVMRSGEWVC